MQVSSCGGRVGGGRESREISSFLSLQDVGTGVSEWTTYLGKDGVSERGELPPKMASATAVVLSMVAASSTCWSSPVSWDIGGVNIVRAVVGGEIAMD